MNKTELISPGGSYSKCMIAAENGADAVYLGVPFTSLRMRQNDIKTFDIVKKTIQDLHDKGTKAYLTMNIIPRNHDIDNFKKMTKKIKTLNPDGIIFGDPGTFQILKEHLPDIDYHLSTQANTLNYKSVQFWKDLGVSRIILARELHLDEIKKIRKKVPDIELEVFAHGAMCMSYSGRCLLGDYFSGRESNKGECSHVCRFGFDVYIKEKKRPNKFYKVNQTDKGSHILSSKDLCTIDKLQKYIPYVDGIKIEGRSKGEFYVGATTKAYRHTLDSLQKDKKPDHNIKKLVNEIPHRRYWDGFMFNDRKKDYPEKENQLFHKIKNQDLLSSKEIKIIKYSYGINANSLDIQKIAKKTGLDKKSLKEKKKKILDKISNSQKLKKLLGLEKIKDTQKLRKTLKNNKIPTSFDKAGPIINKRYHGLIYPKKQKFENDTYSKLQAKNTIEKGDELEYITANSKGTTKILDIRTQDGYQTDKITCNDKPGFVKIDKDISHRVVLYK